MTKKTILRLCSALWAFLLSSAIASAQNSYGVNLTSSSTTVKSFTDALTRQTGAVFSYEAAIAGKSLGSVSVHEDETTVEKILDRVLVPNGISYKVVSGTFVLSATPEKPQTGKALAVSGIVTDSSGSPLPGAGILVKGTTTGTVEIGRAHV